MSSPRYLAEHMLMPRFLREQGAPVVLNAIEQGNAGFFLPVWMQAGVRFTPKLVYRTQHDLRIGVLTLPMPQIPTEAYLAVVVGRTTDPAYLRYFLWEMSESVSDGAPGTVLGEWAGSQHRNYGAGPAFSRDFANDCAQLVARVAQLCSA